MPSVPNVDLQSTEQGLADVGHLTVSRTNEGFFRSRVRSQNQVSHQCFSSGDLKVATLFLTSDFMNYVKTRKSENAFQ